MDKKNDLFIKKILDNELPKIIPSIISYDIKSYEDKISINVKYNYDNRELYYEDKKEEVSQHLKSIRENIDKQIKKYEELIIRREDGKGYKLLDFLVAQIRNKTSFKSNKKYKGTLTKLVIEIQDILKRIDLNSDKSINLLDEIHNKVDIK